MRARRRALSALLMLTIGLWLSQFVTMSIRNLTTGDLAYFGYISFARAITCSIGVILCLVMASVFRRFSGATLGRQVLLAIAGSLIASVVWSLINGVVVGSIGRATHGWALPPTALLFNTLGMIWLFIAWSGIWLAVTYNGRMARSELLAANAQNQMLRCQLNPHFLFNTLSALATLISERESEKAEQVVLSLSRFLRASLERSPQERITVRDEIAVQEEYLAIERARFEDRLQVSVRMDPDAVTALTPSLILQPLVENAVKYGVGRSAEPVTLDIVAQVEGGRLRLTVGNDGCSEPATPRPTLGVGLTNVRARLALLYGDAASLTAGPRPGGGYEATIDMPAEF